MKPDLKQFVDALKKKDLKSARELLNDIESKLDLRDEFWLGYHLALRGMLSAVESGDELAVISKMLNGKMSGESAQHLMRQIKERVSQPFRPKDELGFNTAWVEALQLFQAKD
jgi:hypothetical protein